MTQETQVHFKDFNLPEKLLKSLTRMKFDKPMPIQEKAIPLALSGRDIVGSAQTGTGKTGAFGIPVVAKLMEDPEATALILTPTRELASQVVEAVQQMIPVEDIKTALLIGGDPMQKQYRQLNRNPRLIVGTPGRINDHLNRGRLKLDKVRFLVLDETDRMLDMGFGIQIDAIIEHMPQERQTLLFSATLPHKIVQIAKRYTVNAERIAVGSTRAPAANVKQEVVHTNDKDKYTKLLAQLETREGSVIIFVKTKYATERLAKRLCTQDYRSDAIHGDLKQRRRDRVIKNFRDKKYRILVATDIAARGLDIPHIEHVINYDLPQCPEDYIHRIGRTARAGAEGEAVNMLTKADGGKWKAIERLLGGNDNDPSSEVDPFKKKKKPRRSGFKKNFSGAKGKHKSFKDRPARKGKFKKSSDTDGESTDRRSWKKNDASGENKPKRSWKKDGALGENKPKRSWKKNDASGENKPKRSWKKEDSSSDNRKASGKPFRKSDDKPTEKPSGKPFGKSNGKKRFNKSAFSKGPAKGRKSGAGKNGGGQARRRKAA